MSTVSQIQRIKEKIADTYDELRTMGATIPSNANSENLANTIESATTITAASGAKENQLLGNLTNLTLPSTITVVPQYAMAYEFYSDTNLLTAVLDHLVTINSYGMEYAFQNCVNLTTIDLSSVTAVNDYGCQYMLSGCSNLTSLDLSSLATVGQYAFQYALQNCTSLTTLDLSSLTTAGSYAFQYLCDGCTNLESVDLSGLGSTTDYAFQYAFQNCVNLKYVTFGTSIANTSSNNYSTFRYAFQNCSGLVSVDFSNLTTISGSVFSYAFYNSGIKSANFTSLTTISGNGAFTQAFYGCTQLTSVSFNALVTTENAQYPFSSAFENCTALTSINFPVLTTIGRETDYSYDWSTTFKGCTALRSIEFPALTTLGYYGLLSAFENCTSLESASFPELTTIYYGGLNKTFYGCSSLTTVNMPKIDGVLNKYALHQTFYNCTSLETLDLSMVTDASNPSSMESTCAGCTSLKSVDLSNLTSLYDTTGNNAQNWGCIRGAFYGCTSLKHISFPKLTSAGKTSGNNGSSLYWMLNETFRDCTSLKSVNFPVLSTTSINTFYDTFYNCSSLSAIEFPRVPSTSYYGWQYAFRSCTGLEAIALPSFNNFSQGYSHFAYAFYDCSKLFEVQFPYLRTIGNSSTSYANFAYAFNGTKVKYLNLPYLYTIYQTNSSSSSATFYNNTTIERIDMAALNTISGSGANYIFNGCSNLREIHFGISKQSTITAMSGYNTLWGRGAGNATVYFDLVGYIRTTDSAALISSTANLSKNYLSPYITSISCPAFSAYKLNTNLVGNLLNNNGVLSNFNYGNCATFPTVFTDTSEAWELTIKMNTGAISSSYRQLVSSMSGEYSMELTIRNSGIQLYLSGNGTSWNIASNNTGSYTFATNTDYYVKLGWDKTAYTVKVSTDNSTWTTVRTVNSTTPMSSGLHQGIGGSANGGSYWIGTIDLRECKLISNITTENPNGTVFWEGASAYSVNDETYKRSSDDDELPYYTWRGNEHYYKETNDTTKIPVDIMNVTETGTLSKNFTEYSLSGFSTSNYATISGYPTNPSNAEITIAFKTGSDITTEQVILGSSTQYMHTPVLYITNGNVRALFSENGSTWKAGLQISVTANTVYTIKLKWNGSTVAGYRIDSNNGMYTMSTYSPYTSSLSSICWDDSALLGVGVASDGNIENSPFLGTIYLNSFMEADKTTWWSGHGLKYYEESDDTDYDAHDNGLRYTLLSKPPVGLQVWSKFENFEIQNDYENAGERITDVDKYYRFYYSASSSLYRYKFYEYDSATDTLDTESSIITCLISYSQSSGHAYNDDFTVNADLTVTRRTMNPDWDSSMSYYSRFITTIRSISTGKIYKTQLDSFIEILRQYKTIERFTKEENPSLSSTLYEYDSTNDVYTVSSDTITAIG